MSVHIENVSENCHQRLEFIPANKLLKFVPVSWIRCAFNHHKFEDIVKYYIKKFNEIQLILNNRYYNIGYFIHKFHNSDNIVSCNVDNNFKCITDELRIVRNECPIDNITDEIKLIIIDRALEDWGESLCGSVRNISEFRTVVYIACILNWDIGEKLDNYGFNFIFECLSCTEIYDENNAEHVEFMKKYDN